MRKLSTALQMPNSHARRSLLVGLTLVALLATLLGVLPASLLPAAEATVPTAPSGSAVISVKVGGDRAAGGSVNGLQGVKLSLYGPGDATTGSGNTVTQGSKGSKYGYSWATCTSDGDGDCNFTIPIRSGAISETGAPQDTRFWVVQDSNTSPTGWYSNPKMRVGYSAGDPEYSLEYRFRTDTELRAGTTYRSTTSMASSLASSPDRGFMRNLDDSSSGGYAANVARTTGTWSQSRTNPVFPAKCGLKVALVTDTSTSLGSSGIAQAKTAMGKFVDAFSGTPTTMSLFSFSDVSPGASATNHPTPLPVTTSAQAATFKAQYASWQSNGGTNWDQGLTAAANAGHVYDLVVVLTDGSPSVLNSPATGVITTNSVRDVDAGIFSANRLKKAGTRVVAVGVGSAITSAASAYNLRAISGEDEESDYFRAADFTEAATVLSGLAKANCQGSIQVQKMIVPFGGTTANATPADADWQFAASTSASGVTVTAPTTASTQTGGNGIVNFGLSFATSTTTGAVQVVETQQPGYELLPVGSGSNARNALCVDAETGSPVSVTNVDSAAKPGFKVDGKSGTQVQCKIYNKKLPTAGALTVEKTSSPTSGTAVAPGGFVDYTIKFSNTGELPVAVDHTDHLADMVDDATLVSGPTSSNAALTATKLTGPDRFRIVGSVPAGETYTVTYRFQVKAAGSTFDDGSLDNFVTPTGTNPPTECVESTKLCTTHPVKGKLDVKKSSDPASGTALNPGESATYTLSFTNTGGSPVAVDHDDVLTDVLDDADISNITTSNSALTATLSGNRLSVTGSVPAGKTYTVKYKVTVPDPVKAGGNSVLNNYLVPDGATPPTSCVESTNLCTTHPISGDVTVDKAASGFNAPLKLGDTVTYTLTFTHSGGSSTPINYTDNLADVLDDATLVSGPTSSSPAVTATLTGTAPNQSISIVGTSSKGAPITVTYTVKVKTASLGNGTLDNCVAEPAPGTDQACTTNPIPGKLTVKKTSDPASGTAVLRGDSIKYTLTFANTGGKPMTVNHTDVLTKLLDDATITAGPTATGGLTVTPSPLGSATSFDIDGTVAGGATATVTYTAKVKTTGLGDGVLDNFLVKDGDTPPTTCVPTPGQDPICTTHPVPSKLTVSKTSDPVSTTPVVAGQVLTYTLTFVNGGGAAAAVDYTDSLAAVLDDADLVAGSLVAQTGLTATLATDGTSFQVTGNVPGGDSLTVVYKVKVKSDNFGDGRLDNFVTPTGTNPPTTCEPANTLCTTHPVPAKLSVVKSSDPADGTTVELGSLVSYTLTFANTGGRAAAVDYTDDLNAALDDAAVEGAPAISGSAHGLSVSAVAGGTFAVTGDLTAGKTVKVTYTLRVKTAGLGDGVLTNVVVKTGDTPPEQCLAGDVLCTEHPVKGKLTVKKTSDPADGSTVAAGSTVNYMLTFTNSGGLATPVDYTDHLAELLDDASITTGPTSSDANLVVNPTPLGDATEFTVNGSVPAGQSYTVTYSAKVKTSGFGDGKLTNVVTEGSEPPGPCVSGDPLCTEHPVKGDLEVTKTSNPASGENVKPGDVVTYTLSFKNVGGQPVAVDHTDDLSDVLDDATLTSQPVSSDPSLTVTPSPLADGDTEFTVTGDVARESTVTVTYAVTIKAKDFGNSTVVNCLKPNGPGADQCTTNPIPGKLSVVKTSDPADGTAVLPGSTVNYTLTFTNSGGKVSAVDHTDLLAGVLDDATLTSGPTSSDASLVATKANDGNSFTVVGDLAGGSTVTVKYAVKVNADTFGDGVLGNVVVKTGDTPPTDCLPGDELCTEHPIPDDLMVTKTADPASGTKVKPGDVLTYTLTFANGGGKASAVDHTDTLAKVLDDADLVSGSLSAQSGLTATLADDGESFRVTGNVPGGKSLTVTYQVKVKAADFGDGLLDNFVRETGTAPPATCEPSDTLCTTHPVPGILTVVKSSDPTDGTTVQPGSKVNYTLTFSNTGGQAADVDYTDYLAKLLDDASITSDPTSSSSALSVSPSPLGNADKFTVTGAVDSGKTATVKYTATVKASGFGDGVLTNVVVEGDEPPGPCVVDDQLCTEHPVAGTVGVVKSSDPKSGSAVTVGDTVNYTLTFTHTGGASVPVDYTDHLAKVLDDADLVSAPTSSDSAALAIKMASDGKAFSVKGSLADEAVVTVKYSVKVKAAAKRGDSVLANFVVEGDEVPPTVCADDSSLCTEHPVGELSVTKTSDPKSGTQVAVDDTVTYTLTFSNVGAASHEVDFTDHLSDVLDDAVLTKKPAIVGASHGLSVSAVNDDKFTVGGDLAAGQTVTVKYSVRVLDAKQGNNALVNFLVEGDVDPAAECTSTTPLCTEHDVAPHGVLDNSLDNSVDDDSADDNGILPNTGGPALVLLMTGLLALLAGLFTVGAARRRRE